MLTGARVPLSLQDVFASEVMGAQLAHVTHGRIWTRTQGPIVTLLLDLEGQVGKKATWRRP